MRKECESGLSCKINPETDEERDILGEKSGKDHNWRRINVVGFCDRRILVNVYNIHGEFSHTDCYLRNEDASKRVVLLQKESDLKERPPYGVPGHVPRSLKD